MPGVGHKIQGQVAGAAPPAAIIEGAERIGIDLTHVYGLTEVYGPASVCSKQDDWAAMPIDRRAERNGRQGVRTPLQEALTVLDPDTMQPVPWDGETMGEIMFRGNITMKGYLKNPAATDAAFEGGWFHTGDLAVMQPDGYVKIRDRSKDIIISGGENISSIEVEETLYRHPAGADRRGGCAAGREVGRDAVRLCGTETRRHRHGGRTARNSAASIWPASRCLRRLCFGRFRRRRPEKFRNSRCGSWRNPRRRSSQA